MKSRTCSRTPRRRSAQANAPISQLRKLRDSDNADGFDRGTWAKMVELGWSGIPWPEEYGGLAFGYKGLGRRHRRNGPYACGEPVDQHGLGGWHRDQPRGFARIRNTNCSAASPSGELIVALALEESHRHDPYHIATKAREKDGVYKISGKKTFVLDGHVADKLIVVTRTSGKKDSRDGLTLFLVDRKTKGVKVTRTKMADSRNAANIQFRARHGDTAIRCWVRSAARADILERTLDVARIGLAAEMLGSTEECFERTVQYLKEREQFGVPIGSFQALKHRAADMFCEVELSKSVVLEALTALDEGRDPQEVAKLASLAKTKVGETFTRVSREGIQMHGGIGMTDEFDIGFFIKRSAVAEQTFGDVNFHRNRYGELEGY